MAEPTKRSPVEYCEDVQARPGANIKLTLTTGDNVVAGESVGRLRHNGFFGLGVKDGDDLQIVSSGSIAVLTLQGHCKKRD